MVGLLLDGGVFEEEDKKESKLVNVVNSKVSVVENVIVYMKSLKQENVDFKKEVQDLKEQLEKLQLVKV